MRQIDRMVGLIWMVLQSNFYVWRRMGFGSRHSSSAHICICWVTWVSPTLVSFWLWTWREILFSYEFSLLNYGNSMCHLNRGFLEVSCFKTSYEKCCKWRLNILFKKKKKERENWHVPLGYLFVAALQISLWKRVRYLIWNDLGIGEGMGKCNFLHQG